MDGKADALMFIRYLLQKSGVQSIIRLDNEQHITTFIRK